MQNVNNRTLIEELDKLLEQLSIPSEYSACLTGDSFVEAQLQQNIEACEWLTTAMRGLEVPNIDPTYAKMRAVKEKRGELQIIKSTFVGKACEYLRNYFATFVDFIMNDKNYFSQRGQLKRPDHSDLRFKCRTYARLLKHLKVLDKNCLGPLRKSYCSSLNLLLRREAREFSNELRAGVKTSKTPSVWLEVFTGSGQNVNPTDTATVSEAYAKMLAIFIPLLVDESSFFAHFMCFAILSTADGNKAIHNSMDNDDEDGSTFGKTAVDLVALNECLQDLLDGIQNGVTNDNSDILHGGEKELHGHVIEEPKGVVEIRKGTQPKKTNSWLKDCVGELISIKQVVGGERKYGWIDLEPLSLWEDFYGVVDWAYKIDPLCCISMHGTTERYLSGQKGDAAGYVRLLLDELESRISIQFSRFVDDACYQIERHERNARQTGVLPYIPRIGYFGFSKLHDVKVTPILFGIHLFASLATRMEQFIAGQSRDLVDQAYTKIILLGQNSSKFLDFSILALPLHVTALEIVDGAWNNVLSALLSAVQVVSIMFVTLEKNAQADPKYADIFLIENYAAFQNSLYDLANVVPTLAKFYHQASEAYEHACTRHISMIIYYQFERLFQFARKIEDLILNNVAPEEIPFQVGLSKADLRKTLKSSLSGVDKSIAAMYKKLQKNLTSEELLPSLWDKCKKDFLDKYETFVQLVAKIYPAESVPSVVELRDLLASMWHELAAQMKDDVEVRWLWQYGMEAETDNMRLAHCVGLHGRMRRGHS
ncbi:unnamed protein product [Sphenostylis stenocarpa]|uniref:Exocyst complex component Sec3 C-terminal domain-containing protein n=1 Tax=Sphenostylis stenocarpa TaxID=92480 RepID=A0AA86VT26_9FABA|nr:unnamed protein product [Sphenostylis stenocarpa]